MLWYIWGGSALCILRGCRVVAEEDTEERAAEPAGRQRARPQFCPRFSASEDAVQGDRVGRSPQGEALGLPQHSSCEIRCGIEKGCKGQPKLLQEDILCVSHNSLCAAGRAQFVSPDRNCVLEDKLVFLSEPSLFCCLWLMMV